MLEFKLNGKDVSVDAPPEDSLLSVLTNDLTNTPEIAVGAPNAVPDRAVDGESVRSCVTRAQAAIGRSVTTLAGLLEDGKPNKLQQAFIDEQAAQCGYCINGMIMEAQALLDINPHPTESEVRDALDDNLCRCGTHNRIVRAVLRAAREA